MSDIEKLAKDCGVISDDFLLLPNGRNNLIKFAEAYYAKHQQIRSNEDEKRRLLYDILRSIGAVPCCPG